MGVQDSDPLTQLCLPPGFRFYPTDQELMVQYLCRKVAGDHFSLPIIGDIDLYKFDPWVLPGKALFGEKEWYFFSPRDRKYPNGSRPNRVAGSGYWKATGTDKVIISEGRKVGIKKALVFYIGKAPKGTKTNWIMHEYRLFQSTSKSGGSKLDDWVLCRIYKKKPIGGVQSTGGSSSSTSSSYLDDVMESSFPEIEDRFFGNTNSLIGANPEVQKVPGLQSFGTGFFDWSTWAGLADGPEVCDVGLPQEQALGRQMGGHVIYDGSHVPLPSLPPLCHVDSPEEKFDPRMEAERSQRVNALGDLFGQRYSGSVDPFGIRYAAGLGFGL